MTSMRTAILKQAVKQISTDTKFIRLATITTFIHSLLFLIYVVYVVSNVITTMQWKTGNQFLELIQSLSLVQIWWSGTMALLIIVWLILLIGYAILPPIGEAAMIYYLDNPKKQWTLSLWKWVTKFFPMFEFDAAVNFVSFGMFAFAISRMYIIGILENPLTQILVGMRWCIVVCASILLPYTRFVITLEDEWFFDAMKRSAQLAINHIGITIKFLVINVFLFARFIINIALLIGIPLLFVYILGNNSLENELVQIFLIIIVLALFMLTAYINGIIEAFFNTYWYILYTRITSESH